MESPETVTAQNRYLHCIISRFPNYFEILKIKFRIDRDSPTLLLIKCVDKLNLKVLRLKDLPCRLYRVDGLGHTEGNAN
jgi:hypothetical protein